MAEVLDRATKYSGAVAFENKNGHGYYNFRATSYEQRSGQLHLYNFDEKVAYVREMTSCDRHELVITTRTSTFAVKIEEGELQEIRETVEDHLEPKGENQ